MMLAKKKAALRGLVGLFKDPFHLLRAAKEVHKRGLKDCDAFTPYPVHGIDEYLRIRRSWIPWVTLVFALLGCLGGLALQVWISSVAWPLNIGGKPFVSLPAFIPVVFECTILVGGIATFVTVLWLCGLPNFHARAIDEGISDATFALYVPSGQEGFDEADVQKFMVSAGAYDVKRVGR